MVAVGQGEDSPLHVGEELGRQLGRVQTEVAVEEPADELLDFARRDAGADLAHGDQAQRLDVPRVEQRGDDDGWIEWRAGGGHGVEAVAVGRVHGGLPGAGGIFGQKAQPGVSQARQPLRQRGQPFLEVAVGAAHTVAHLAQRRAQVARVPVINLRQQRIQPLQLLHDEAQRVVDLALGLRGGQPALGCQVYRGAVEPGIVQQPPFQPVHDVPAVARNVVAGLERMVGRPQGRRVIVEL